jgi:ribosomal protein L16 Arg81 hydroxylase
MPTTDVTQQIAGILRAELARTQENSTWFGRVIGRSQSHASQVLQGKKPLSTDELALACTAFGLQVSAVFLEAETRVAASHYAGEATTGSEDVPSSERRGNTSTG